jgi:hypothetical protein
MDWPTKINIRTVDIKRVEANVQDSFGCHDCGQKRRTLQIFGDKIDKPNDGGNMPHLADVRFADVGGN